LGWRDTTFLSKRVGETPWSFLDMKLPTLNQFNSTFISRFNFCSDRKRACAASMQWLRGKREDIGAEFSLMADTLGRMERMAGESVLDMLLNRSDS
jgi:hypothetical protein